MRVLIFKFFATLIAAISLMASLGVALTAQPQKAQKGWWISATARICGPNHPIPDYELPQRIAQVHAEGCMQATVIQTEPHFYLVFGTKILMAERGSNTDVDTAPQ